MKPSSGLGEASDSGKKRKKERREKKRGEREEQIAVPCGDKAGRKRGRRGDEEGEAGERSGRKAGAGQWRGKEAPALESFLHKHLQRINTVQQGFFLFLTDIFESVSLDKSGHLLCDDRGSISQAFTLHLDP